MLLYYKNFTTIDNRVLQLILKGIIKFCFHENVDYCQVRQVEAILAVYGG